ncbi:MAG: molecular chaperone DnaJ [Desulfobacteraceae bacterium]|nr:molecular chaperone DnaJ [Desulfobacteraceae bacterium]
MSEKRDYYEVLGVDRNANAEELKTKYRKIAMKHHPDRNPGDKEAEEKFKEAAEAYEVLCNPEKRQMYDQFGHRAFENGGAGQQGGFRDFEDIFSSFGDIFEDFFGFRTGTRGGRTRAQRGADLRYDLTIEFTDAAFGKETELELEKMETCDECRGTGAKPGTAPETCDQCRGTGQFVRTQGFFQVKSVCPKCRGQGKVIKEPCPKCMGRQQVAAKKKVDLKIPAGVDTGSRLRLAGEGEPGVNGGPAGDLYVFLRVKQHDVFERRDNDIVCKVELSFIQASLGDEITVPTLTGEETVKIPQGTQYGDIIKLTNQGIPSLRTGLPGDELVEVVLKTPKNMSKRQEELLREFEKLESEKITSRIKRIFTKSGTSTSSSKAAK